jgi:hypothetical protein
MIVKLSFYSDNIIYYFLLLVELLLVELLLLLPDDLVPELREGVDLGAE